MVFFTINRKELDLLNTEYNPKGLLDKNAFLAMYYAAIGGLDRPVEKYQFLFVDLDTPVTFYRGFTHQLTFASNIKQNARFNHALNNVLETHAKSTLPKGISGAPTGSRKRKRD
jgi:hypothetical protein